MHCRVRYGTDRNAIKIVCGCLRQVLGIRALSVKVRRLLCDVVFVTNSNTELKGGKQLEMLKLAAKYTGIDVK